MAVLIAMRDAGGSLTYQQISDVSGLDRGKRNTYMARLRRRGLIEKIDGGSRITRLGRALLAGDVPNVRADAHAAPKPMRDEEPNLGLVEHAIASSPVSVFDLHRIVIKPT